MDFIEQEPMMLEPWTMRNREIVDQLRKFASIGQIDMPEKSAIKFFVIDFEVDIFGLCLFE